VANKSQKDPKLEVSKKLFRRSRFGLNAVIWDIARQNRLFARHTNPAPPILRGRAAISQSAGQHAHALLADSRCIPSHAVHFTLVANRLSPASRDQLCRSFLPHLEEGALFFGQILCRPIRRRRRESAPVPRAVTSPFAAPSAAVPSSANARIPGPALACAVFLRNASREEYARNGYGEHGQYQRDFVLFLHIPSLRVFVLSGCEKKTNAAGSVARRHLAGDMCVRMISAIARSCLYWNFYNSNADKFLRKFVFVL